MANTTTLRFTLAVVAAVLCLSGHVAGHGAMVDPLPRNAIDRNESSRCPCGNSSGVCNNGQSCYWYNQGCFIGCPTCDSVSGRIQADLCGKGKKATLNDPSLRTVNRNATPFSEYDIYVHNPWRAPGSAPVVDSCGLAGGTPWRPDVSEWGTYVKTTHAEHGDYGTKVLPYTPSGRKWKIGGSAEVTWQITANHGGGYQYRLCPLGEMLTEECFFKTPLDFDTTKQQLVYSNGTRHAIKGTFVTEGVEPAGSMWAMNPIPPRCLGGSCHSGPPFCEPCPLPVKGRDCTSCDNTPDPSFPPPCDESKEPSLCSGNQPTRYGATGVIDVVKVPATLAPGKYVLGWRLDCESTAQVWASCADIELVA